MYTILNVDETRKQQHFLAIKGTLALTQKTMYDVFVHSSLPTSAILALGLLKKERRKMMNKILFLDI